VAALATFVPATLLLAGIIVLPSIIAGVPAPSVRFSNWVFYGELSERALGLGLAAGSLLTVFCTANIYASLKPIRAWHDRHVVPASLLLALYGGGLLLPIFPMWRRDQPILLAGMIALSLAAAWLKHRYWRSIDAQPAIDAGRATGLDALGRVRGFEQPNTEENYLTHEMGFALARKHARKLRSVVLVAAFLLPALLAALALALPATRMPAAWLALVSGAAGLFVERWLFFAEAKHAVMAYYQR
jgi:DMSO reductase anchor subunit